MTSKHQLLLERLADLICALKVVGLWRTTPLPPEAYQSVQPFSVDTMSFSEWLQFIFIEKLTHLAQEHLPLPPKSAVAEMAEQYFSELPSTPLLHKEKVVSILRDIDRLLSE